MEGQIELVSHFQTGQIHERSVENDSLRIADPGYGFGHDVILCFTATIVNPERLGVNDCAAVRLGFV